MKRWMIVLIVFILTTASCGKSHTAPREPVTLASLQTSAVSFDHLASGNVEGWNSRNRQAVTDLFTEDAEARDRTYGDHAVGRDQIAGLIAGVASFGPSWQARVTDQYIGSDGGLAVDELWDLQFGSIQFTQDHPFIEVDWLQTRDDLISNWTIFYGRYTMEELEAATPTRLILENSLVLSYRSAWSSGDQRVVAALYTSDAVREDMVFMERQEGQKAIASFAESFFNWYPDAQWNFILDFGEGHGDAPITGGLYVIKVKDDNGQPCEVKVAVLLQTSENLLITHETLYYEPQSLISCGWAR
jgi:ketosteroid isomerase-like protein